MFLFIFLIISSPYVKPTIKCKKHPRVVLAQGKWGRRGKQWAVHDTEANTVCDAQILQVQVRTWVLWNPEESIWEASSSGYSYVQYYAHQVTGQHHQKIQWTDHQVPIKTLHREYLPHFFIQIQVWILITLLPFGIRYIWEACQQRNALNWSSMIHEMNSWWWHVQQWWG